MEEKKKMKQSRKQYLASVTKEERNLQIYNDYKAGIPTIVLAKEIGRSKQRISQIVQAIKDNLPIDTRQE